MLSSKVFSRVTKVQAPCQMIYLVVSRLIPPCRDFDPRWTIYPVHYEWVSSQYTKAVIYRCLHAYILTLRFMENNISTPSTNLLSCKARPHVIKSSIQSMTQIASLVNRPSSFTRDLASIEGERFYDSVRMHFASF